MNGQPPVFIVDVMLGKLARWLRLLGLDALYVRRRKPEELRAVATSPGILVTRDHHLTTGRKYPGPVILIESTNWQQQIPEFLAKSGCRPFVRPFTRCPTCNGLLAEQPATAVEGKVPRFVAARHRRFCRCTVCGQIYWPGSHQRRVREMLRQWGLADTLPRNRT
ncbi:MAG: Mut7-C RNAse domain-containing protein [Acidobacteria bacterium]|nr:Mut7-C RNAse domain-containing protein [Acidobacteriota bacterium]